MKLLTLSNGTFAKVDDEDYDRLSGFSWNGVRTAICRNVRGKSIPISNEVMKVYGVMYDHIDRDPRNNQKSNLRQATYEQNSYNRVGWGVSGYKGVCKYKQKWKVRIRKNTKEIYLGLFKSIEDAAKAYDKAAKELFGEFAVLNFPDNRE